MKSLTKAYLHDLAVALTEKQPPLWLDRSTGICGNIVRWGGSQQHSDIYHDLLAHWKTPFPFNGSAVAFYSELHRGRTWSNPQRLEFVRKFL